GRLLWREAGRPDSSTAAAAWARRGYGAYRWVQPRHLPHDLCLAGHWRDRPQADRSALTRTDRGRDVAPNALAVSRRRAIRVDPGAVERADLQAAWLE